LYRWKCIDINYQKVYTRTRISSHNSSSPGLKTQGTSCYLLVKTYIEKYVHNKLEMISLFDDYNEYHVDIEEFKSDVKIYKKENLISEI
jgi:hypothetical protein